MATYFSSLLTHTTSRYNNLRRALLSDEADGDTEADSHISRVLRAYYIEKGRAFPPWLPPDPRTGVQSSSSAQQYAQSGSRQAVPATGGRRGGGLSDLFDSPSQPSQPQQPMSLRRGGPAASMRGQAPPPQQAPQSGYNGTGGSSGDPYLSRPQRPGGARLMPGQRDASMGSQASDRSGSTTSSTGPSLRSATGSASGGTAQDRLKAKLWGAGRSASPADPYGRGSAG